MLNNKIIAFALLVLINTDFGMSAPQSLVPAIRSLEYTGKRVRAVDEFVAALRSHACNSGVLGYFKSSPIEQIFLSVVGMSTELEEDNKRKQLVYALSTQEISTLQHNIELMEKHKDEMNVILLHYFSFDELLVKFTDMDSGLSAITDKDLSHEIREEVRQFVDALREAYHQHGDYLPNELSSLEELENHLRDEVSLREKPQSQ